MNNQTPDPENLNTLDMTPREYPVPRTWSAGLLVVAMGSSVCVGAAFSMLRYYDITDWPWIIATAGLWVPAVAIALRGAMKFRRAATSNA